ncbi:MAG: AI-2E family transporter [Allosphingosinicella sp.]|uniref:AI-2E family transporter n=1 Tax=Allosphingosinicella sp. TaxID=2823234 RepID=UPI00395C82E8
MNDVGQSQPAPPAPPVHEQESESAAIAFRRDRLLAALTLIAGAAFALALPFALRAGAEFFLPVTAALVIAIAMVPLLEWLERRRVPSALASLLCILLFIAVANIAVVSILIPMTEWVRLLPERIGRIQQTLAPLFDVYASLEEFIEDIVSEFGRAPAGAPQTVTVETPNSMLSIIATSAPFAVIQMLFAVLLIFFFLAGWTRMRQRTITSRGSFDGAMTTARVIQQVVDATSTYLGTITMVNIGLGLVVALALYLIGMPTPLMWGGIVAVLNYIPYLGPLAATLLLALGGLMAFPDPWQAFLPVLIYFSINLVEANVVTPTVVGKRLTINPMLILLALSFWAWVWGTTGALLAVPILIIMRTVLEAAGKPDIAGFLFEEGTLISAHHEEPHDAPAPVRE